MPHSFPSLHNPTTPPLFVPLFSPAQLFRHARPLAEVLLGSAEWDKIRANSGFIVQFADRSDPFIPFQARPSRPRVAH